MSDLPERSAKRSHRLFLAGVIGLIVFAAIHLLAVFKGLFVPPASVTEIALKEAALAHRQAIGPFLPSAWGGIQILNSGYSVLLFFVAAVNLFCWQAVARAGGLRRLAQINAAFCGVLALIPWMFQFPPPAVLATIVTILFWAAAVRMPVAAEGPQELDSAG